MKIGFQYPVSKHVVYIFNLKYIKHKPVKWERLLVKVIFLGIIREFK